MTARLGYHQPTELVASDWMLQGHCRDRDPELFFATTTSPKATRDAKTVCAGCPVRVQCLEYALSRPEPYGVWGGASEHERQALRRIRR